MFFCGADTIGGSAACNLTPIYINNINYVEISNAYFDDLYISTDPEVSYSMDLPDEWDWCTVLYAKFNNNTYAGNIDTAVGDCTHILLKRRLPQTFKWQTIFVKEINTVDDFDVAFNDYTVRASAEMEYAVVPILNGLEGTYTTITVKSEFTDMFLISNDTVYGTPITDGFCDTTRNIPSANVELLNAKYPIFVRNSQANYDTGDCTGSFINITNDDGECSLELLETENDYARTMYQKEVMDFICDGAPKILKLPDGRMWLVQVTPNPTDTADTQYNNRNISFSWVEIGDVNSEEDMYYLGLNDIDPQWWNYR